MSHITEEHNRVVTRSSIGNFAMEAMAILIIVVCSVTMVWQVLSTERSYGVIFSCGTIMTLSIIILLTALNDPDSIRSRQTDAILGLTGKTLAALKGGLTPESATTICELLLPISNARGVVITDTENVLGQAGFEYDDVDFVKDPSLALTAAAITMADGQRHVLKDPHDDNVVDSASTMNALITVPLSVGARTKATLQFYFRRAAVISNTQLSIADGFGEVLSTQLAASELEEQTKLASDMKLKALQNQINPHFLFNTLNTIASLIRTDPMRARNLLREFATFYRSTLKDPDEHGLVLFKKEMEQTRRYFSFEEARFGADRVAMELDFDEDEVGEIPVPAFIIQPLVENAVGHAMPAEGKLTVSIEADFEDVELQRAAASGGGKSEVATALVIRVKDNGIGMSEEACKNILAPKSSTGAGIAVKNVHDRIKGYYGSDSSMVVESVIGAGTTVTLTLILDNALV